MKYYAKVENGVIVKRNLTRKQIGVGEKSSDSVCNSLGYYEIVYSPPTFNKDTQTLSISNYLFDDVSKIVKAVYTITDIPAKELTAKKIKKGEQYIKDTVKGVVDAFNTKYGVTFDSIYNMAIYKDDVDYPLHTQCDTLIKWQNSMWATARANQPKVIDGTMTDKEFLAALPVAPEV